MPAKPGKRAKAETPPALLTPRAGIISLLPFQEEAFVCPARFLFLLWRRQSGKSHLFAAKAMRRMAQFPGRAIYVVNASILMGTENILKEAQVWAKVLDAARAYHEARGEGFETSASDDSGNILDLDAIADLFEHNKLEAKLYHSNAVYSRTRVVAPNPLTARGMTGDVLADEIGFWPDFQAVFDAVEPVISRNPDFMFWAATTPPMDDSHPVFDLLMPTQDSFPVSPTGNWFQTKEEDGEDGYPVLRVDAHDSLAAGLSMFDKKGKAVTIEKARSGSLNKASFDRNYLLKFVSGGSAAIARHLLLHAQGRAAGTGLDLGVLTDGEDDSL